MVFNGETTVDASSLLNQTRLHHIGTNVGLSDQTYDPYGIEVSYLRTNQHYQANFFESKFLLKCGIFYRCDLGGCWKILKMKELT